ncbi:EamA family transporter [Ewingella sp. S1.OA.A_B6]
MWFYLIQNESAEFASYATLLSPVITVMIASVFMNEDLATKQIFGFSLLLISAMLVDVLRPYLSKVR